MFDCCCKLNFFKRKMEIQKNPANSGTLHKNAGDGKPGVTTSSDGNQCGFEITSQHNIVITGNFNMQPSVPDSVASITGSYRCSSGSDSLPRIDFNIDVFKDERFSDMSATIFHTLSLEKLSDSRATSPINNQLNQYKSNNNDSN